MSEPAHLSIYSGLGVNLRMEILPVTWSTAAVGELLVFAQRQTDTTRSQPSAFKLYFEKRFFFNQLVTASLHPYPPQAVVG